MPKRPLLVYLDEEDRKSLEEQAKREASTASAVARRILHLAVQGEQGITPGGDRLAPVDPSCRGIARLPYEAPVAPAPGASSCLGSP